MLDNLMTNNEDFKKKFGTLRDKPLYHKMIENGTDFASIFIIKQIAEKIEENFHFFVDGTFRVSPHSFKQLLILFAIVARKVRSF